MNLNFQVEIEGVTTTFPILSDIRIPIPICNENAIFVLPGDGSIEDFARIYGDGFSKTAVDVVLQRLGLEVSEVTVPLTIDKLMTSGVTIVSRRRLTCVFS